MRARAQIKSHPIHPMLIAFPIGLWLTSFVLDAIAVALGHPTLWAAGFWCVIAGCVGAAAAAVPGLVDLLSVVPPRSSGKKRGYIHGLANTAILVLFIIVAARRGDPFTRLDNVSIALSLIGAGGVIFSGWLGATLVYRNQIGVDHRYANAGKWKERELDNWERPACNEGELAYGQMMLIHVGGQRVVVGRCSEGVVAFSDRCTHKGGPLSDGALSGCTVQCPWHGSQFDLRTGRVVAGPAEQSIDTFETRIVAGEVYIVPPRAAEQPPKAA